VVQLGVRSDAWPRFSPANSGGLPWSILGTTFEVAGVVRAEVDIDDDGIHSGFTIPGVGEARARRSRTPSPARITTPPSSWRWVHLEAR
jgi:hypothetical protein